MSTKTAPAAKPSPTKTAPADKKSRPAVLSYAVFGKLEAGKSVTVAGIVRKVRSKVSSTGEALVFVGDFAHRIDGGEVVTSKRAIFPAKISAAFPAEISAPTAFSFTFKDKAGSFVRTPSAFSVATLLP